MVELRITDQAFEQFADLPKSIKVRVEKLLDRLENWPDVSGAKPLTGELAGHFRLRTGDYRLQFCVEGERIIVEKIGHRDRFYEQ